MGDVRQKSFGAGEIAPAFHARSDLPQYAFGLKRCLNFVVTPEGRARTRCGTIFVGEAKTGEPWVRLIPFFTETGRYCLELGNLYVRFWHVALGELLESAPSVPLELVTPFTSAQLWSIRYAQDGNDLTLCHPSYDPRIVTFGGTLFTIATMATPPARPIAAPTLVVASGGDTAAADPDHPGRDWEYGVTAFDVNGGESAISNVDTHTVARYPDRQNVDVAGTAPAGTVAIGVYAGRNGVRGFIGAKAVGAGAFTFEDDGRQPDFARQPPLQQYPFGSANNRPALVCNFEGRRFFAKTNNNLRRIWGTKVNDPINFDIYVPLSDDNAIDYNLRSELNEVIEAIVPAKSLVLFTDQRLWLVNADGSSVTSRNFAARPHSKRGTVGNGLGVDPLMVGDNVVFLGQGNVMRAISFSEEARGVISGNLSFASSHLLKPDASSQTGQIVREWNYSGEHDQILWLLTYENDAHDGQLLGVTLDPEHEVVAWHRHEVAGADNIWSMATFPKSGEVMMAVARTIDGASHIYIELMSRREQFAINDKMETGVFLDCSKTFESLALAQVTITDLDHLEGEEVYAVADGAVFGPETVTGGEITLDHELDADENFELVHVGLKYTPTAELLDVGNLKGNVKGVRSVTVEVEASRGLKVGEDEDHLVDGLGRQVSDGFGSVEVFTGTIPPIPIKSSWNLGGRIVIRQDEPLSLTILGVTRDVIVGGS